jgi:acetoin utilization protein AcuB
MARSWKLLRGESAATTTEYAIILTLIVSALILAGDVVRLSASSTFQRAGSALGAETGSGGHGDWHAANGAARHWRQAPQEPAITSVPWTSALAFSGLATATAIACLLRCRRRREKRPEVELPPGCEPAPDEPNNPNFRKRQEIQRALTRHFQNAGDAQIEIRRAMSTKVRTVAPTAAVAELRDLMQCEGFHHLLVTRNDELVGVISDRDLLAGGGPQAQHVMTANPLTVSPKTPIAQAITLLLHQRISCLPVVEEGRIAGILTVTDLLMTLQCLLKLLERAAEFEPPADGHAARTISQFVATGSEP